MKIRTVSGNLANLLPSDAILKVSAVVACSVQLGLSRDYAGLYTVKKTESSANAVTIYPATGEKIDGADSVTLATENEYKTLAPADGGWTVVDAYTTSPTLIAPTTLILNDTQPVNAVAAKVEIAAAVTTLLNTAGDKVEFEGSSFTYKASEPGATEYSDAAGLATLLGAVTGWDAAESGGKVTITAATAGIASNNKNAVLTIYSVKTAGGGESAKATCTIPAADLAQLAAGDSVTFDSVEYVKAAADNVATHAWKDTAGLISCIDVAENWVATASSSDVVITAAANGATGNDKDVDIIVRRKTASGVNGTVASKGTLYFHVDTIYLAKADNTIADANWVSSKLT